jgi:hypothetical protein
MDDKLTSDDLLLENESLRKELHDLTQIKKMLHKDNILFSKAEQFGSLGHWKWDLVEDKLISCSDQFARIYDMTVPEALECFVGRSR